MSRGKLVLAAWIGGLVTAGGAAVTLLLGLVLWIFLDISDAPDVRSVLSIFVSGYLLVLGVLFLVGWSIGFYLRKGSSAALGIVVMVLLAFMLPSAGIGSAVATAATLIGPSLLGWSLGRLKALRSKEAIDQA